MNNRALISGSSLFTPHCPALLGHGLRILNPRGVRAMSGMSLHALFGEGL